MKRSAVLAAASLLSISVCCSADETVEAAVGGGIGGAAGAAIGEKLGDRDGAIIGAAIGGALGAAIATDEDGAKQARNTVEVRPILVPVEPRPGRHCPPGQAKKGRC